MMALDLIRRLRRRASGSSDAQRVAALSGRLEVRSTRGGGFELVATFPVESAPGETVAVETGAVQAKPANTAMEMQ